MLLKHDAQLATTVPSIVAQPDNLVIDAADEPAGAKPGATLRDEEVWRASSPKATGKRRAISSRFALNRSESRALTTPAKSYIALKKGRRCWLPMWPLQDGARVYVFGGPGGMGDAPSDFFTRVKEQLAPLKIEPTWSYSYNAGANPVAFAIPSQYAKHSLLINILKEAYGYS